MKKYKFYFIVSIALFALALLPVEAQQYFASSVTSKGTSYLNAVENALSFAVISDIHFGNSQGEGPMVKVPKALKNITSHKALDAIFVVGDLTDGGSASQYAQFVSVFGNAGNYTNPVGKMFYMLGNHDNYDSQENYVKGLRSLNNGNDYPLDQYIVIKGYPFITISQRGSHNTDAITESHGPASYPQAVQDTLAGWLERAATECPGKPIFVFTHVPPKYTCYSSWPGEGDGTSWPTWSMKVLNPILNNYPQAVVFGGHSHFPIGDPRSIHQGVNPNSDRKNFFTGINTGSTTYSEIHKPSVDIGIHPEKYDYVTEGLILTAQSNGDVEIQRWDTYRNREMHPENRWMLKAPHDGSAFRYADKRDIDDVPTGFTNPIRDGLPAPLFASTDVPSVNGISFNSCTVTFPQATDNDYVFRYLIRIKKQDGTVVKESCKFSQFYLNNEMPATLSVTIDGLSANTTYSAEVTAYDSYDNTSMPIVSTSFTTLTDNVQ
jgi:predicted phosphodiesterase